MKTYSQKLDSLLDEVRDKLDDYLTKNGELVVLTEEEIEEYEETGDEGAFSNTYQLDIPERGLYAAKRLYKNGGNIRVECIGIRDDNSSNEEISPICWMLDCDLCSLVDSL